MKILRIPKGTNRTQGRYLPRPFSPLSEEELELAYPSGNLSDQPMSEKDLRGLYEFGALEVRDPEEWEENANAEAESEASEDTEEELCW